MTTRYLLAAIAIATLPLSLFAQSSPVPSATPAAANQRPSSGASDASAPDAAELTKLLHEFLAGASRNDIAMHDRFWADDLIYTSALGRRKGKADIMRELRSDSTASPAGETATFTGEDIRIQQYGTTAIVAFRLVGTTKKGDTAEVANYLNTGTFLKRGDKWQVVSWQATKLPPETEEKK